MIRVELPQHLQTLARVGREVEVSVSAPVTLGAVLDAIETRSPVRQGTSRDQVSKKRRPFVRFFIGEEDWSHTAHDDPLPDAVAAAQEAFVVVGAIAGG